VEVERVFARDAGMVVASAPRQPPAPAAPPAAAATAPAPATVATPLRPEAPVPRPTDI
jgi:hypothetical protein